MFRKSTIINYLNQNKEASASKILADMIVHDGTISLERAVELISPYRNITDIKEVYRTGEGFGDSVFVDESKPVLAKFLDKRFKYVAKKEIPALLSGIRGVKHTKKGFALEIDGYDMTGNNLTDTMRMQMLSVYKPSMSMEDIIQVQGNIGRPARPSNSGF